MAFLSDILTDMTPRILILVNDRPAQTVLQAAIAHGLERTAMQHAIRRAGLQPAANLDARTPVYFVDALAEMMKTRPGRGSRKEPAQ